MKRELHKWQYGYFLGRDYARMGGYKFSVWCVWLKFIPMGGEMLLPRDYYGFIWELRTPHATTFYAFKLPLRLRIILAALNINTHDVYVIPTAFTF